MSRIVAVSAGVWIALQVVGVVVGLTLVGRDGTGVVEHFDVVVHDWFVAHRSGVVGISRVLGVVFDAPVLGVVVVVVTVAAVLRARLRGAFGWSLLGPFVAYLGAEATVFVVRIVIHRPRPASADSPGLDALSGIHETSWSFPSGHATGPIAVFVALAGLVVVHRGGRWPYVVAALAGVLVGVSRLVLGVHWASDVMTGLLLGAAWGATVCWAQRRVEVDDMAASPGHVGSAS